jgi:hypothetical protein
MSQLFGRNQVAEAPSALLRLHFHSPPVKLKEVDWEPKAGVIDQQDLLKQGIRTSQFIPGCSTDVNELGSCTANATLVYLSNILTQDEYGKLVALLGKLADYAGGSIYTAVVAIERAAIGFYHGCTDQTASPSQEWPPTDCGSSGPYIYAYLQHLGVVADEKIAHGAQNLVSLLQGGAVLQGTPFLNAWMQPDSGGFVDGSGSVAFVQTQIQQGVAGGHQTVITAIEKLAMYMTGQVNPWRTVVRVRNSWSESWGDNGSFRIHLSTLTNILGQYCDFRQPLAIVPTA